MGLQSYLAWLVDGVKRFVENGQDKRHCTCLRPSKVPLYGEERGFKNLANKTTGCLIVS